VTLIESTTPVRVSMGCAFCAWRIVMSGPALEVAHFLRARAQEHVRELHPEQSPAGDLSLTLLAELGFR
jgi:hypothetical protein